jgi:hypothetical protein
MKTRLTDRIVREAEPKARDWLLWDTEKRGLGVKITPKGKRVYVFQYRLGGRVRRYTVGEHGQGLNVKKARDEVDVLRGPRSSRGTTPARSALRTSSR